MVSPYFKDLLNKDQIDLAMDATFDSRPQFPRTEQLLSVHAFETIDERQYCWPCAYVLMEKKDQASYETALSGINESIGGTMNPRSLMADFEKGVHNAAKNIFPNIETSGCWFHNCNALWGQVQQFHLIDALMNDENVKRCIQKCMALPLLPPGEIENGLTIIEEEMEELQLRPTMRPLFKYIHDFWLNDNRVGVDMLSVFELDNRTNNAVERSHFDLFNKVRIVRPSFWQAYGVMKMYDFAQHQDRIRALQFVAIRRNRRQEYVVQDNNIKDMQNKLLEGILDVSGFLSRACHTVEGLQKRLKNHYRNRRFPLEEDHEL